jgi:hypothetical protein
MREIAVCDRPVWRAVDRVDHDAPAGGSWLSVVVITFCTCSRVIVLGRPGRGPSASPASRSRTNRDGRLRVLIYRPRSSRG